MKKIAIIVAALFATPALSADLLYVPKAPHVGYVDTNGWYLAGHAAADFNDDFATAGFDTGYSFSTALGYNFGQVGFVSLREEAELGYLDSNLDVPAPFNGSLKGVYGFLNTYADFGSFYGLTPFINGGVGYASLNGKANVVGFSVLDDTDQKFAWNAGLGVSYDITKNVTLDVAYRYIAVPDVTFTGLIGTVNDDVNIQQVNAGFRVKL